MRACAGKARSRQVVDQPWGQAQSLQGLQGPRCPVIRTQKAKGTVNVPEAQIVLDLDLGNKIRVKWLAWGDTKIFRGSAGMGRRPPLKRFPHLGVAKHGGAWFEKPQVQPGRLSHGCKDLGHS